MNDSETTSIGLTPAQIKNWRDALVYMLGPYAVIMPDEEVVKIHAKMQETINSLEVPNE